mgnify:CR=1 FL=1
MALDDELLDILVCPQCKGSLLYLEEDELLFCEECSLKYKIEDDIPVMLVEEAEEVNKEEKSELLEKADSL